MAYWTIRAITLGRISTPPSQTYAPGRKCRACGVPLSGYNSTSYCACHEGKNKRFSVDDLLADHWPSYLPDPAAEPWRYTPDELALLALLSRHQQEWLHLMDGQANNIVRKLRRKGFSIEGRAHNLKGGGYRLMDRIPTLNYGEENSQSRRSGRRAH